MRTGLALLVALLASHVQADAEQRDPMALLDAMSRNFRALDYSGVFTYEQGQTIRSVRIVHSVVNGMEQERLVNLDGEQREFLRRDHPVDCLHVGDRLVRMAANPLAQPLHELPAGGASRLSRYYSIEFDGSERIASRNGSRLRIRPRDPYRYGMTLVLDDATSLLLKSETTDGSGRVLERFQFVDVGFGAPPGDSELQAESASPILTGTHAPSTAEVTGDFAWTVSWLPEGFMMSSRELRHDTDLGRQVETQMYTDGLAVFAVFVDHGSEVTAGGGQAAQGATVAYVTSRGAGNVVTVVGEIPIAAAQLVANSVNFPDDSP